MTANFYTPDLSVRKMATAAKCMQKAHSNYMLASASHRKQALHPFGLRKASLICLMSRCTVASARRCCARRVTRAAVELLDKYLAALMRQTFCACQYSLQELAATLCTASLICINNDTLMRNRYLLPYNITFFPCVGQLSDVHVLETCSAILASYQK